MSDETQKQVTVPDGSLRGIRLKPGDELTDVPVAVEEPYRPDSYYRKRPYEIPEEDTK